MRRRFGWIAAVMGLTAVAVFGFATSASASFHLIKIRAIFRGTGADNNAFIELQMDAPGQNFVNTHVLTLFPPASMVGSAYLSTTTSRTAPTRARF